ncbi:MAG: flagellar basal body L-ring protein FlgH [Gammaproteobacteria bacterium]|nr:MAG: flagellar basal body L-ring protein FlgH [Gammaproteobacteria bacterium]
MKTPSYIFIYFVLIISMLLSSCASPKRGDPEFAPMKPISHYGPMQHNDSIYQLESAWLLLEDLRPRHVGDMLTVMLQEKTDAKKSADTDTSKVSANTIAAASILGAPLTADGRDLLATKFSSNYDFQGEAASNQSNSLTGSVTVTVVEVLANGNLVVQGEKWININKGEEYIRLRGIVRISDINPDNTISSERIANAQIQYSGDGDLANANEQGWLSKFFNSPWMPF